MSVDVELVRAHIDICNEIYHRVKKEVCNPIRVISFFPDHYYEVSTEIPHPGFIQVWIGVRREIYNQLEEDLI